MSEIDDLRAAVAQLQSRVTTLEDHLQITQLVAEYGPSVDSGSAEATARLWTDDGVFDAVGAIRMEGRDEVAGMVRSEGHQSLILNGCGHVLTVPHVEIDGDDARGRSYALNIRWDPAAERFWVARLSANTWRWKRTSEGWRITQRVNANLDGSAAHRRLLAPPDESGRAASS